MGRRKPDITRNKILQSALEVFVKKDIHLVNIREIAKRAGVCPASIYKYFKGKEDLLFSLIFNVPLHTPFTHENIQRIKDQESTKEKLKNYLWLSLYFYAQRQDLANITFNRMPATFWVRGKSEVINEFNDLLVSILKDGKEKGELNPKYSTAMMVDVVLGLLFRSIQMKFIRNRPEELTILTNDLTEIIYNGLKPESRDQKEEYNILEREIALLKKEIIKVGKLIKLSKIEVKE